MKSSEIVAIARANADSLSATKNPPPGIIDTLRMCADEIERLTQAPDLLCEALNSGDGTYRP